LTNSFDHFRCPQICRQSGALFLPPSTALPCRLCARLSS
jgi:hypothetical protein